jgi:hypothetical protein
MLAAHTINSPRQPKQRFDAACCHLRDSASNLEVIRAAAILEYLKVRDSQQKDDQFVVKGPLSVLDDEDAVICAECFRVGTLSVTGNHSDKDFLYHSIEENHTLFVRTQDPQELFCMQCGDYSYSSLFDLLTKRPRSSSWGSNYSAMKPEDRVLNSMGNCT